jgi:hypothetical protein
MGYHYGTSGYSELQMVADYSIYGIFSFAAILFLFFILILLIAILFYDGLCDKYDRAFKEYGLDFSKRQIVEKVFNNFTDDDKKYILKEC